MVYHLQIAHGGATKMPKSSEIAAELRKIADALDLNPNVEVKKPCLSFYYSFGETKESFLAAARLIPHPVEKVYGTDGAYPRVSVRRDTDALLTEASIYRKTICTIVEPARPAVYDCNLTLSEAEDASLTEA